MEKGPAQAPAPASVSRQIGATARRLRNSLGLTLGEVAKRSGISAAMLSRLENGDVSPSLETLASLTAALGVPLANLFNDVGKPRGGAQHVPKGQGLEVVRRGTKRGHTYHLLAADRGPRRAFEPFLVTLNDKSEVFPGFEHPGTEFIYLLEGSLTYRHGDETHLLKAGDALTFSGEVPHGPEKLIKTPIRMLSIIIYAEAAE
ncbi:MAG TPA: XRE family transcriptional regulator [Steroidobacteraceae bacterium]|nr:XRE family transcriptional regulator [Steroidobacteraceae bacterium]